MTAPAGQRYDLLERIAAGGMGEVFVGRVRGEHGFQKPVAIKRILPALASNPEFVVRFVAEAKLAVSLSHANVVQVFDLGRAGDELLLVMEYVRGTDVGQLLARLGERAQPPPVAIAVYLAMEALKGLVYAHERRELDGRAGIIHCDLSPSNLLISWAGEVKIGDFGVAQAVDVARRGRGSGAVMGKLRYLAPEQLVGEPLDPRTDLYSLAVVLHEALTLRRPFDVGGNEAIVKAVVSGGHAPVSQFRSDVPPALDQLIARAMTRRPGDRPESARAMLAELARIAQRLDAVTPPDVGSWARLALEEREPDPPQRRTGSMPTVAADRAASKATMTFIVRQNVDGVTVLDREMAGARARWRSTVLPGLLLGTLLFAGGIVARRLGHASAPRLLAATFSAHPPATAPTPPPALPALTIPPEAEPPKRPPPAHRAPATPGFVNIYAEPWANAYVDGRLLGVTPLAHVSLPAGAHRIRLQHPKARPVERLVRVESGRTELVDVDLDPGP